MPKLLKPILCELRSDRLIYGLILLYIVLTNAILLPVGHVFPELYVEYFSSLVTLDIMVLPAIVLAALLLRSVIADPKRPSAWVMAFFDRQRIARIVAGFALLVALVPFMATFTAMKSFIGLSGFKADTQLADFDRWLHFGVDPPVFLNNLLSDAHAWRILTFFYGPGWMLWVNGFVFWMAVAAPRADVRKRFFVGYIFAWAILGNVVAWLVVSAGPAFFAEVAGDTTRFASVLSALDAHRPPSGMGIRDVQIYLWELYITRSAGFGMGISAFPSVHLAMVTLCALTAAEINRHLAYAGAAVVFLIQIGAVLFGWHYAIDGYFSIATMVGVWLIFFHTRSLSRPSSGSVDVASDLARSA
ncbi:hypothetical protein CXZ10_11200 [Pleomorphomonas diazotrophica]|uniref:Inositolphosphotransferase Aur1/Ipt1 domain-containing protein n=1 Tax=Pleomorphomonas diazotrophica TaxID=1166257 RepID=A0A1I4WKH0_9HYPH|nr:phosphatase PAP2 family protein [Pleomorphomonas diazotrophica]PKR89076.1 hypothetical protein CXZ10_11200 [Pleomorphomonas diazotrophica]SFN13479.1 PAP2 superfamily protein [Pleomorphomonas diazotrophica]